MEVAAYSLNITEVQELNLEYWLADVGLRLRQRGSNIFSLLMCALECHLELAEKKSIHVRLQNISFGEKSTRLGCRPGIGTRSVTAYSEKGLRLTK